MQYQGNRWIYSGHWFIGSFDALWSQWSWSRSKSHQSKASWVSGLLNLRFSLSCPSPLPSPLRMEGLILRLSTSWHWHFARSGHMIKNLQGTEIANKDRSNVGWYGLLCFRSPTVQLAYHVTGSCKRPAFQWQIYLRHREESGNEVDQEPAWVLGWTNCCSQPAMQACFGKRAPFYKASAVAPASLASALLIQTRKRLR